jgi:hypothetical protein
MQIARMHWITKIRNHFPTSLWIVLLWGSLFVLFGSCLVNDDLIPWAADHGMPPHRALVEAVRGGGGFFWDSTYYLGNGRPNGALLYPNWPILAILPMSLSFTANIALHLFWAGCGAWFCARILGVSRWGAALSAIAFGLSSHTVSLLYPGHIAKIQAIVWIPWTIGYFWKAWHSGRPRDFLLTAICFAPALQSGEPQIPLYLGFYLPLIALVGIVSIAKHEKQAATVGILKRMALSALCAVLTLLLAFQAVSTYSGWMKGVRPGNVAEKTETGEESHSEANQKAKWDFATGWSFPPEDSLTFLLSGQLFGGRSPGYFGRMGTDTMKLKETDDYAGVLIVFLALLALGGIRRNKAIGFLFVMLISSLLIGYGRYTPIYRLIYALPTMASQRVPARWIAFTVFAFTILAGFGLDRLIQVAREGTPSERKRTLILPALMIIGALVLIGVQFAIGASRTDFAQHAFGPNGIIAQTPQTNLASLRAARFLGGLRRAEVLLFIGAGLCVFGLLHRFLARTESQRRMLVTLTIVGVLGHVAIDLTLNAKHFVEPYNWRQYHKADSLVQLILNDADLCRVQPIGISRHPALNRIVGAVGSWNRLRLTEQTSMNVLPPDIAKTHKVLRLGKLDHRFNPRYYDLFNVKYLLTPFDLPADLQRAAGLKLSHRIPYGGNVPPLMLYEYTGFNPNPGLAGSTRNATTEDELLQILASPAFDPATTVAGIGLPQINGSMNGTARVVEYGKSAIKVRTRTDGDAWIIMREHFDPNWKASIDGENAPVYRLNLLHFGVPVSAGAHEIVFAYRPPRNRLAVVSLAWITALLAVALSAWFRRRKP